MTSFVRNVRCKVNISLNIFAGKYGVYRMGVSHVSSLSRKGSLDHLDSFVGGM